MPRDVTGAAPARRKLYTYVGVIALYALVSGWWIYFFAHQSDFLVERLGRRGITLPADAEAALREATDDSMRMFTFEGGFLGLLLLASMFLVVRALQRELALHRQQNNFLSAVTHELKSPIASARLYVESLLLGRAEGDKRERYLKNARADLDRLHGLVEELLQSARMKTGARVAAEPIDLTQHVERIVEALAHEPATAQARIELEAERPCPAVADPAAVRMILHNLVSNAVKYAGPEPRVQVSVRRGQEGALLRVRDFGPGLVDADADAIFEAFVRGGDENVRTRPGVGLGLYLVAELARAQKGAARAITDLPGGGFAVEVELPAA